MAASPVARTARSTGALDSSEITRWVERTCRAQGLPVVVTDRAAIARLVTLLGPTASGHPTIRNNS
jgi:hypothetical protein